MKKSIFSYCKNVGEEELDLKFSKRPQYILFLTKYFKVVLFVNVFKSNHNHESAVIKAKSVIVCRKFVCQQ